MLRRDMIQTKIKEIEENLRLIEDNLPGDLDEFLRLGLIKDGIYKRIEFSIQNVLDICATVNSDLELGIPSSEEEIVENLMEKRILSNKIGRKVKEMKGFRNFLVHRYGRIDDKIAFEKIKGGLGDFRNFIKEIEKSLLDR